MQKRMISQTLAQSDHPTAAEVYERVRHDCPQISLGTVYRNLAAMAQDGEVLRLSFLGDPDRFDPNTHEHFHAVCSVCGRIFDTDDTLLPELIAGLDQAVEQSTGIRVEERTLHFSGVCQQCRNQAAQTADLRERNHNVTYRQRS
jgi:Fur family peroxide stress response transcriptional regulator